MEKSYSPNSYDFYYNSMNVYTFAGPLEMNLSDGQLVREKDMRVFSPNSDTSRISQTFEKAYNAVLGIDPDREPSRENIIANMSSLQNQYPVGKRYRQEGMDILEKRKADTSDSFELSRDLPFQTYIIDMLRRTDSPFQIPLDGAIDDYKSESRASLFPCDQYELSHSPTQEEMEFHFEKHYNSDIALLSLDGIPYTAIHFSDHTDRRTNSMDATFNKDEKVIFSPGALYNGEFATVDYISDGTTRIIHHKL